MSMRLAASVQTERPRYGPDIEEAISRLESLLTADYGLSRRAVALLLLQGDDEMLAQTQAHDQANSATIERLVRDAERESTEPLAFAIAMARQAEVDGLVGRSVTYPMEKSGGWGEVISRLTIHPVSGSLILLAVLYFGLYVFVGQFGAGTLVGLLEEDLFGGVINPWIINLVEQYIPWLAVQQLLVGEYGVITLAVTYAIALVLPIVGTFFLVFSVIEDSGYLPRLALLIDRVCKVIGLNGRAVIPLVLGFGCDTMATIVTRVLETKRERLIATMLMALAIPCSAQLGVVLGLLAFNPAAMAIWAGSVGLIFLLVGFLAARLLPGEQPSFYMELPPLRLPQLRNVLAKTYARMEWYFFEVFPIFVGASVLIWLGQLTGLFDKVVGALQPAMQALGLPSEAAVVFLFGFFRRDYGAAGLYDLAQDGLLGGTQLVVAAVTLTLFLPCVAQFSVMIKERGLRAALAIAAFIFPFAFAVGVALNTALVALGVTL
ncbi:MAG: nucleoside recognition domain-containing protein [Chloroflexota bacterium]